MKGAGMYAFLAELVTRVLKESAEAITEYVKYKMEQARLKKAIAEKMKEIMKEPNREIRAKRMRDFLSSL